jgi:hypothetical protein
MFRAEKRALIAELIAFFRTTGETRRMDSADADIVYQDGGFIQIPAEAKRHL